MADTQAIRQQLSGLLPLHDPGLAPTAYYALFHPLEKSTLVAAYDEQGELLGFAGRMQTGIDLFRPLVTLYCQGPTMAAELLAQVLAPGRPYLLFATQEQLTWTGGSLRVESQRTLNIYALNPREFSPEANVMVQPRRSPDGLPRCVVERNGEIVAAAGLNWRSPHFAEIYVHTEVAARQRGWGRSVVACLSEILLRDAVRPLYLVEAAHEASLRLVEGLGFYDTGAQQVYADVVYTGSPLTP